MADLRGNGPPTPVLETVDDRLRKLEAAVARLSGGGGGPAGLMPLVALPAAALPAAGRVWGKVSALRELRLMLGMYFDPRYRLSRAGQFGIPAVFILMALDYLVFNWVIAIPLLPLVGAVLERAVLVLLAVVLYKLLSHEATRYGAVLDYLTKTGR
jgi:hypothetical protein